jgi:hypothetical protein
MMPKPMDTLEFNTLIEELIAGLPVTMVVNRLQLVLKSVIDNLGEPGRIAFRKAVYVYAARDVEEE